MGKRMKEKSKRADQHIRERNRREKGEGKSCNKYEVVITQIPLIRIENYELGEFAATIEVASKTANYELWNYLKNKCRTGDNQV